MSEPLTKRYFPHQSFKKKRRKRKMGWGGRWGEKDRTNLSSESCLREAGEDKRGGGGGGVER